MNKFIRYCMGYVRVRLIGSSPERMLNMCGNKDTIIWDLVKNGDCYEFCMPVAFYKKIKPIVKKTNTKVIILKKKGIPFIVQSYRYRQLFLAGILMFSFILYTLSQYVWEISVEGSQMYTEEFLIKYLETQNVSTKMKKKYINADKIEENLILNHQYISWASVEIKGSKLIVHLKEAIKTYEKTEEEKSCDIVASEDGVITSIVTRKGTPMVKKGDKVKKGDVLISGTVDLYNDGGEVYKKRYVKASGDIKGEVLYNYKYNQPLAYEKKEYTGREQRFSEIYMGDRKIKIKFRKTKYTKYDRIVEVTQAGFNKSLSLPFVKHKVTYKEYVVYEALYSENEVKELAKSVLDKKLSDLQEEGIETLENNVKIQIKNDVCYAKGTLLLHQNLGEDKEFNADKKEVDFLNELNGEDDSNTNQ